MTSERIGILFLENPDLVGGFLCSLLKPSVNGIRSGKTFLGGFGVSSEKSKEHPCSDVRNLLDLAGISSKVICETFGVLSLFGGSTLMSIFGIIACFRGGNLETCTQSRIIDFMSTFLASFTLNVHIRFNSGRVQCYFVLTFRLSLMMSLNL